MNGAQIGCDRHKRHYRRHSRHLSNSCDDHKYEDQKRIATLARLEQLTQHSINLHHFIGAMNLDGNLIANICLSGTIGVDERPRL